jgi:hypothetical protein
MTDRALPLVITQYTNSLPRVSLVGQSFSDDFPTERPHDGSKECTPAENARPDFASAFVTVKEGRKERTDRGLDEPTHRDSQQDVDARKRFSSGSRRSTGKQRSLQSRTSLRPSTSTNFLLDEEDSDRATSHSPSLPDNTRASQPYVEDEDENPEVSHAAIATGAARAEI